MGYIIMCILVWLSLTGIVVAGPLAVSKLWYLVGATAVSVSGALLGGATAISAATRALGNKDWRQRAATAVPAIVAPIGIVLLLIVLATLLDQALERVVHVGDVFVYGNSQSSVPIRLDLLLGVLLGLIVLVVFFSAAININRFSLHAMYRSRLIRAYLGASRKNRDRQPDPFTGFDPADNLPMYHMRRRRYFTTSDLSNATLIAEFWKSQSTTLSNYIWTQRIDIPVRNRIEQFLRYKAAADYTQDTLAGDVVTILNKLLEDSDLTTRAGFEIARDTGLPRPTASFIDAAGGNGGNIDLRQIRVAYARCCMDQFPFLLNRLILEAGHAPLLNPGACPPKPLHLVNMTLNLVGGENLAWQSRKAASFTATPLHAGFKGGYRHIDEYAGGLTLGTAVTISGAAASPNMGYHSSPAVTFLMTLFNVRLGWWLGNPAKTASSSFLEKLRQWLQDSPLQRRRRYKEALLTYQLASPRLSVRPVIDEALGRTNDRNEYIYLSDGGHFDNLGLYEMVLRRCRTIVVCDASCDPDCALDDLAIATRNISVDLGIRIQREAPDRSSLRNWRDPVSP
jgi:hypothetical protein